MTTYHQILEQLDLVNKTIAYLKLDIEMSELEFFDDVFKNYPHYLDFVEQIGIDIHLVNHFRGKSDSYYSTQH